METRPSGSAINGRGVSPKAYSPMEVRLLGRTTEIRELPMEVTPSGRVIEIREGGTHEEGVLADGGDTVGYNHVAVRVRRNQAFRRHAAESDQQQHDGKHEGCEKSVISTATDVLLAANSHSVVVARSFCRGCTVIFNRKLTTQH
eukprot:scaffold16709_cov44-Phaeocystis_antarctica.AAC.1